MTISLEETLATVTNEQFLMLLCHHKGIKVPCKICHGLGTYMYSNSATWHKEGMACQAFTNDICDNCWGSGDENKHGLNLRQLTLNTKRRDRAEALKHISSILGCNLSLMKLFINHYADTIENLSKKRKLPKEFAIDHDDRLFWYKHMAVSFANMLRLLIDVDVIVGDLTLVNNK